MRSSDLFLRDLYSIYGHCWVFFWGGCSRTEGPPREPHPPPHYILSLSGSESGSHVQTGLLFLLSGDIIFCYWAHVHDDPAMQHLWGADRGVPADGAV